MIKLLALAVSGFVMAFIAVFSPLFDISSIVINDDQECLQDYHAEISDELVGENILFMTSSEKARQIQEKYNCVDTLSVDRQLPATVVFGVRAKVAVARIADTKLQITSEGLLTEVNDSTQLPTIFLSQKIPLKTGEKVENSSILAALKITKNLLKSDFVPETVRIVDSEEVAVYSNKDILAVFSTTKDPVKQVDSLQLILAEAKIDATKLEKIDLRFEKPIITYKE